MTMQPKHIRRNAETIDLTRCFAASDRQQSLSRRAQALMAAAGMDAPERRWYVVTVDGGMDMPVAETLAFAGVEIWVPVVARKSRRRGGLSRGERASVNKLALPGYLFARVTGTVEAWAGLQSVKGVSGILGNDGRPLAVTDRAVALFRAYLDGDPAAFAIVTNAAGVGDAVIVTDGPFRSFYGRVDGVDADLGRVAVEILLFGRLTPVHLDLAQISKL